MEANICDIGNLDADVLLPPRKRLLAGYKKQNSDGETSLTPPGAASSSSSASPSWSSPQSPCSTEYQARLNTLLTSHLNKNHNLSPEQIVQASKSAAESALRAAQAARAAAQEKAIIAAQASKAAKSALALVACFPEEAANGDRNLKKNKSKKHVQLQLLYKKHRPVESSRNDEELARRLHRVMNSSPRISKNPPSPESKGQKKVKEVISEGSIGEKSTQLEASNGDAESSHGKERISVDAASPGKRRGRQKLKKLPLSICSSRDQAAPKDDNTPVYSGEPCVKQQQNKVIQS